MPDELDKECINCTKGKCLLESELIALEEQPLSCENCFHRQKLKEGEETTVTEIYTLKRINGNLAKVIEDIGNEDKNKRIYIEL